MKKVGLIGLLIVFLVSGCAHGILQLESGPYSAPDQTATKAVIGAGIGAVPGIIAGNKGLAWGGALLGGAIGGWLGNTQDQKNLAVATQESRAYREQIRQEWMQTYQQLAAASGGTGKIPRVIVVDAEGRSRGRGWEYSTLMTIEQGLRQRGFEVTVPSSDEWYRSYYRGRVTRNYSAVDADFIAEILVQDLDSAVKVIVTLRSLTGKNVLDRQGVGKAYYAREYYQYGPSREERRERAATLAAKGAVLNLFIYRYENSLDATM